LDLFNSWVSGISPIQKIIVDNESPWNIPLFLYCSRLSVLLTSLSSCVERYQMPFVVFKFFLIFLLYIVMLSNVHPCIICFQSDILFVLLVLNCVLPNAMGFSGQFFLPASWT
jgi:hypothetical protein